MSIRRATLFCTVVIVFLAAAAALRAIAQGGPPPEVREHIQAFTAALNHGGAEAWEQMAQAHFAPGFLARRSAAERRELFERLRGEFGRISIDRVTRRGPAAPLELHVRTTTGEAARILLQLEAASPFRIDGIGVEVGAGEGDDQPGVPPPPVNAGMSNEALARALDGYLSALAAQDVLSGVVLVAKQGTVVFEKAYGYADRANKRPNATATRFNLGSINKIFTRTAIAQLVARGKLAYTDTLGSLMPDYPQQATRPATVEQLLDHRAGVADVFGDEFARTPKDRFRSNADYFRFVSSQPPLFAPGASNQYCNGCYIALGAIVEKVAGVPYEKYIADEIYAPAGMKDAGPLQSDAITPNVAMGYTRRGADGQLRSNIFLHGASGSAAGGGYATAADLLAFDTAMKAGKLLDAKVAASFYGGRGFAGGAPGTSALLESDGAWTVIVLTNLDPPTGQRIGAAITRALRALPSH